MCEIRLKPPLAGDLDLVYKGEETRGRGIITATSIVDLTWKLTYHRLGHRGSIVIKGEAPITTKASSALAGTVQVPKSVAVACCAAYILENLASKQEHVTFLKQHPPGVKMLAIGVAREVSTIPACRKLIEDETSGKHVAKDYIICADVSPTQVLCHPGPTVLRDGRLCYRSDRLVVRDDCSPAEASPAPNAENSKRRKSSAGVDQRKDETCRKILPDNVVAINTGRHRGLKDLLAMAMFQAEVLRAKERGKPVCLKAAAAYINLNPFTWDDLAVKNKCFVIFSTVDEEHHIATCYLRKLIRCCSGSAPVSDDEEEAEA